MQLTDDTVNKYITLIIKAIECNNDELRPEPHRRNLALIEHYKYKLLELIIDTYNETNKIKLNINDICK